MEKKSKCCNFNQPRDKNVQVVIMWRGGGCLVGGVRPENKVISISCNKRTVRCLGVSCLSQFTDKVFHSLLFCDFGDYMENKSQMYTLRF